MTSQQRHACMSHIRSKDTRPEQAVRRELWRRGYRYRLNVRTLPGSPDIVLPKYRTAIFVNGCFWHGHRGCSKYTVPDTNTAFWVDKVRKNKERDTLNTQSLESLLWSVLTIWECELKPKTIDATMERVFAEIHQNKMKWDIYQQRHRSDRTFARAKSHRKKLIREEVERELQAQFHIPVKIRKASREEYE